MTNTTMTLRPQHFARHLWHWLTTSSRRTTTADRLDALSDYMRRDIGLNGGRIEQTAIRTQHETMRYSG